MNQRTPVWNITEAGADPADPHFYTGAGYLRAWRQARRAHPVAWTDSPRDGGFWSVTTYAEGARVLKDQRTFASTLGMRLGAAAAGVAAASGRMMVVSDGAEHRRLRGAHSSWFTGRALSALGPDFTARVDELLCRLLEREAVFDAVRDLAVHLPRWALFRMMGLPVTDWEYLARLAETAFDDTDSGPEASAARTEAHTGILGYFADLLDQRRAEPGDDLVSSLAQAVVDGRALTDDEVVLNCDGLVNGGLETTPHAMSGALLAFAEHPAQWDRVRQDPALVDSAVEEVLRWTSPPTHAMRTAVADVVLGDARIGEGDRVVVWIPSCNRDESVFPDAGTFLVDRSPNPHLAFGAGPHYCIGSTLARLELRCFLEVLTRRVASVEVAGQAVRQPSNFLHGLACLPVSMT